MGPLAAICALTMVLAACGKPTVGSAIGDEAEISANTTGMTSEASASSSLDPTSSDSSTTEPQEPSQSPSAPADDAEEMVQSRVYYLVDTRNGLRLARELRDVPAGATGLAAAVSTMIGGAIDPDYSTTWSPDTTVLGVETDVGHITVDLSGDARTSNVGSAGAAMMIQQLVWTVTEAAEDPDATVTLLIDGEIAGELWGAVEWDGPIAREEPEAVRAFLQIDNPRESAEVTSPVTIDGDALAFEANVLWQIADESGKEIDSGFTMTTDGTGFAPFSFDVDLPPGVFTVEIIEDDPSDGEGGPPQTDTRTITVTH
ncbi:MAG: Gmad2 immunoglobulin-like domain-containing protein [Nakamurella sp.]